MPMASCVFCRIYADSVRSVGISCWPCSKEMSSIAVNPKLASSVIIANPEVATERSVAFMVSFNLPSVLAVLARSEDRH